MEIGLRVHSMSVDQQSTVHSVEKVHNLAPRFAKIFVLEVDQP